MTIKRRIVIALKCMMLVFTGFSQSAQLAENYFRSPVDYDFKLSGNFCELRETHFHSGLDIKPSSKGNDKIYSIADGYVSRLRVASGGYGNVLYIDHPDVGYTSVYAHLEGFNDNISSLARQHQMALESFEVDFLLDPHILPVKKGDIIGIMGNSGYSFGTHLHFEIRDTKTEKPINPLLFGMKNPDNLPPSLVSMAIHGLDPDFHKVCDIRIPLDAIQGGTVNIPSPIEVPAWRVGIALQTYDRTDGSHNKLGIYSIHVYVDDSLSYSYHLDKVSFDQTKNIIGFYDYSVRKKESKTFALCYKYPGNKLEFLHNNGAGLINVYASKDRKVRIDVEDFSKNRSSVQFLLRRSENMQDPTAWPYKVKIQAGEPYELKEKNFTMLFSENSLFRNIKLSYQTIEEEGKETKYQIHDTDEPIRTPIFIAIKPEYPLDDKMSKAIIIRTGTKGGRTSYGGTWKDGSITARVSDFGTYHIDYDTVAPTIKIVDFNTLAGKKRAFRFMIKDNYSTKGEDAEDIEYKVWIDGVFTISPLSAKSSIVEIPLKDLSDGSHILKIEAKDHSGNISFFNSTFVKKGV